MSGTISMKFPKSSFWRVLPKSELHGRFFCPKTPEMNVLESYLTNRKNQNEKVCRTAEKSSLEVGGPSLEIEKEKPLLNLEIPQSRFVFSDLCSSSSLQKLGYNTTHHTMVGTARNLHSTMRRSLSLTAYRTSALSIVFIIQF